MTAETLGAFLLFAAAMVTTPGPANLLLFSHGAVYGFRGTGWLIVGVTTGKIAVNLSVGLGLYEVFQLYLWVYEALGWLGLGYICWLAYKVATMPVQDGEGVGRRLGVVQGLWVHPLNPKAWVMSVAAYTQYANPQSDWVGQMLMITLGFMAIQIGAHSLWTVGGSTCSRFAQIRAVRLCLGGLMVGTVLWAQSAGLEG